VLLLRHAGALVPNVFLRRTRWKALCQPQSRGAVNMERAAVSQGTGGGRTDRRRQPSFLDFHAQDEVAEKCVHVANLPVRQYRPRRVANDLVHRHLD
jgi:hypothetical protein